MKIYLLNPPYYKHFSRSMRWQEVTRGGTIYYPIWLAYATGLIEKRHNVRLVDAPARRLTCDDVIKDAISYDPDVIVIDSSYTSWRNDIEVATKIKQVIKKALIVVVGPPTSVYSTNYLQSESIDVVVQGEYELTLKDISDVLEEGGELKEISGLLWKEHGTIRYNQPRELTTSSDLDNFPWVSQIYNEHLNIKDYFLSSALYPEVQIIAERGCPYFCTFCEWPQVFTKRKYRYRSVDNVISEMLWIKKNLVEVKEIVFEDDTFTIDRMWVHDFCNKIIKDNLEFTWSAQVRADIDEFDLLYKMRKAGCRLIIVGFESGSDKVLRTMRKNISVEQSRSFAKLAKKAGILLHGDFIIGLPGETKETIRETRTLIHEIKPEILQVSLATPFPGTEFYKYVQLNGYLLREDPSDYLDAEGHQTAVVSYPELSADEILNTTDEILKDYYLSVSYMPLALKQVIRKRGIDEFRRLFHSAQVFIKYANRSKEISNVMTT